MIGLIAHKRLERIRRKTERDRKQVRAIKEAMIADWRGKREYLSCRYCGERMTQRYEGGREGCLRCGKSPTQYEHMVACLVGPT